MKHSHRWRHHWALMLGTLGIALIVAALGASLIGSGRIPLADIRRAIFHPGADDPIAHVFWNLRLPRIALATLVGAALATAGASLQAVFKNPMADPYLLGVSAGGALGATIALVLPRALQLAAPFTVPVCAFGGSLGAVYAVYQLGKSGGRVQTTTMLLAGIALSALLSAIMSFLLLFRAQDAQVVQQVYYWTLGTFQVGQWKQVWQMLPYTCVGVGVMLFHARELNALLLGEESAHYLGVDVERTKKILLFAASLTCAGAVSVSGIIGFVGLITPHVVRLLIGPDHRLLVPTAALLGALFLLLCDTLARTLTPPTELPVGIFTAFFGVPFFLYLLKKSRRVYL